MSYIKVNNIETYYELHGRSSPETAPIVFIHGGWADYEMWKPQLEYFSGKTPTLFYDVRGHGRTGGSALPKYSLDLFARDLAELLNALKIENPVLCGLSLGGMIAQTYACRYPGNLKAMIMADTAITSALTIGDKILKYILGPKWLMLLIVRMMGMKRYTDFAFRYASASRGKNWMGNEKFIKYEKDLMAKFTVKEYNKVLAAIYDFKIQDLKKIRVPVLILNGENESKSVFTHTKRALELIHNAKHIVIPEAGHASNYENPTLFNRHVEEFLSGNGMF